ncbi:electron transfer flavoprotein subunit beta/FixA family protein [Elusimicrobiota bacterium]
MPFNIVVCVKQTPSSTNVAIDANGAIKKDADAGQLNPFDEYAIEEAVRIKEKNPGSWVGVLTMGAPQAEGALKDAISRGCDQTFSLCDNAYEGADTYSTSYALSRAIAKIKELKDNKVDLVICGKQSSDSDTGQVGPQIASWLKWPSSSFVKKIEALADSTITIHRMMEDGYDVIEMKLPSVISVVKEINEPRLPSLKGKMAAKKAVITRWTPDELSCDKTKIGVAGSPTTVVKNFAPPTRSAGMKIDGADPNEKAKVLADKLKELKVL